MPVETLTRKDGERKFSMNQNLTLLLVLRSTLKIMIEAKRYSKTTENSVTRA